jgi:hypothetical protein
MNVRVHIDRLVLEGLPVHRRQGAQLQDAIEAELGRLLAEGGVGSELAAGGAWARLPGSALQLSTVESPAPLGAAIARTIYGSIGE